MEAAPWAPLYYEVEVHLHQKNVQGAQPHPVASTFALDDRPEVDGHGKDESSRVVGVVADEVDPPRGKAGGDRERFGRVAHRGIIAPSA